MRRALDAARDGAARAVLEQAGRPGPRRAAGRGPQELAPREPRPSAAPATRRRPPVQTARLVASERVGRARATLLLEAARFSRLITTVERRSEPDSVPERYLVRVAARDGDVSLEGLITLSVESPMWRRAEEIPAAPYLDLLRRMLETPVLVDEVRPPVVDPSEPAPRRAVVVRLVIGEEERRLEAVRGESYDRLKEVADRVLEFARTVPRLPDFEAKAAPAPTPPKPGKKRR